MRQSKLIGLVGAVALISGCAIGSGESEPTGEDQQPLVFNVTDVAQIGPTKLETFANLPAGQYSLFFEPNGEFPACHWIFAAFVSRASNGLKAQISTQRRGDAKAQKIGFLFLRLCAFAPLR